MPAVVELLRTIAMLLLALSAPRSMMARVRWLDAYELRCVAHALEWMRKRGKRLRHRGEGLDTVAARIDLVIWIACNPVAALRYRVRGMRGWKRARNGAVAPLSFAPPVVACAALADGFGVTPILDTS